MDNYHIAPVGTGFQIVEDLPDGRHCFVDEFASESDARGWLDSFLIMAGLTDCMAGGSLGLYWAETYSAGAETRKA